MKCSDASLCTLSILTVVRAYPSHHLGGNFAVESFRAGTRGNTSIISWPVVYGAKSFNNIIATFTSSMSSYVNIVPRCTMGFNL